MAEHDTFNPYTAVQRSPSQHWIFAPQAPPLKDNCVTLLTLSHDAVNLNTIPASSAASSDSIVSFASRYVVPEVIRSDSDVDTRSAGNPYSHHPNFTTPSQYFGHLGETLDVEIGQKSKEPEGDVLTVADIQNLKDPFGSGASGYYSNAPAVNINPPNDVTLRKTALSSKSLAELHQLHVAFPFKGFPNLVENSTNSPTTTLNKKMLSPESMYELQQTDGKFDDCDSNLAVIREFSPQTLADLRELRNISQYSDCQRSSKDVATCLGISPSPYERQQFEWTENVAYGGF
ncbi:unnamed protein product [Caenorhabditis sp. 36 PRJEB53466]|nr:unnamed protein product [Caenorhabditis sp. 36 PRJEB53466]